MKKSLFLVFLGCLFMSAQVMAQMTVSGTVTDDGGEPLIGVNIVEKGTTNGTVTDLDGNYAIQVADGATLVFSYVGFQTRELLVTSPTMNLTLIESGLLDEWSLRLCPLSGTPARWSMPTRPSAQTS